MTIGDVINLEKGDDYFKDDLRKDFNVQADDVALNRVEISLLSQEDQLDIDRMTGEEFDLGRERNVEEESSDRNLTKGMGVEDEHDDKNKIKNANRNEMKKENENSTTDLRVLPTEASKKNKKIVTRYGRKETPGFWKVKKIGASDWMTFDKNSNWVWWAAAGYSVSVLLFRVADWLNGSVVPSDWFDDIADNIVHQMVTPEGNDIIALLIGAIAPCLSAPLWEEIFYRGLIYPFLCSVFPMALATPLSALIFALHHGRKQVFIQLFTLGSLWASLYVLSGNLFVSVVVHSLWNSRVFLGSFLGY